MPRTQCRYGDCSLERLEVDLGILNKIWANLEKNWWQPEDIEDLYRVYPLLDTTAAIARKMLTSSCGKKNYKYKVETILPKNDRIVDTSNYRYPDEHKFFNGEEKKDLLANIVSTFLHGSEYGYMDTRKLDNSHDFEIYVFVKTDILCQSCADANLENPKIDRHNFRKTTAFVQYDDCTCGRYVSVRSYIDSLSALLKDEIYERTKKIN